MNGGNYIVYSSCLVSLIWNNIMDGSKVAMTVRYAGWNEKNTRTESNNNIFEWNNGLAERIGKTRKKEGLAILFEVCGEYESMKCITNIPVKIRNNCLSSSLALFA